MPASPTSTSSLPYGSRGSTGSQPSREGNSQSQQRLADATGASCTAGSPSHSGGQPGTGADWEDRHWQQLTEASHIFSGDETPEAVLEEWGPLYAPAHCRPESAQTSTTALEAGSAGEPHQKPTAAHIGCWSSSAVQPHTTAEHQQGQLGAGNGSSSRTADHHSEPSHPSSSTASGRQGDRRQSRSQGNPAHVQLDPAARGPPAASQLKQPVVWQGQDVANQGMSSAAGRHSPRSPCCNANPSTAAGGPSACAPGQAAGPTGGAADVAGGSKGQPMLLEPAGGRQLQGQQGLQRCGDARSGPPAGDEASRQVPAQVTERPAGERFRFCLCRVLHMLAWTVTCACCCLSLPQIVWAHMLSQAAGTHCRVPLAAVHLWYLPKSRPGTRCISDALRMCP